MGTCCSKLFSCFRSTSHAYVPVRTEVDQQSVSTPLKENIVSYQNDSARKYTQV